MTCSPARACSRVSRSRFAEPAGTRFQQLGSHRPAARLAPIARLLRNEFPVPSFFSARSRHYSNIGQSIFFGLMLWALASRCPHPSHRVMPAAGRVSPQRPAASRFWFYAMTDRCDLCRDRHVRTARNTSILRAARLAIVSVVAFGIRDLNVTEKLRPS